MKDESEALYKSKIVDELDKNKQTFEECRRLLHDRRKTVN
jgi:hypothetical protein